MGKEIEWSGVLYLTRRIVHYLPHASPESQHHHHIWYIIHTQYTIVEPINVGDLLCTDQRLKYTRTKLEQT